MTSPSRGAARISAIWMIVVIVLFLFAIAFAFVAQSEYSGVQKDIAAARAETDAANSQWKDARDQIRAISTVLGWYDRGNASPSSNAETAKKALDDLKSTFTDLGTGDADFETAAPKIVAAYTQKVTELAQLRARVQSLESEVEAAHKATTDVTAKKDETIAQLRQQVADDAQQAKGTQQDLETRLAAAQQQLSDRDKDLRAAQAETQQQKRDYDQQLLAKDARINELSKVTSFAREPFNKYPDGKIIEVSNSLNMGWIDIGADQRLTRGTRFQVETGNPGDRRFKAMAEVVDVQANRAEVLFSQVADRYDPPVPGDVILNPLYDPKGGRNAVLVGRFSGAYNEPELKLLLERMGIHVQPALDRTTNFLIVGSELWTDPETNEPLEEPLQPSELPVFKNAEAQGVQIIPLQDIREFFRVDALAPAKGASTPQASSGSGTPSPAGL